MINKNNILNSSEQARLHASCETVLSEWVKQINKINPDFIEGIYITGSLSLNDFHPNKSDIDFLVFCTGLPDKKRAAELNHIHHMVEKIQQGSKLSGLYINPDDINISSPEETRVLSYQEGMMRYENFGMAAVSLTELKNNAITIYGKEASTWPFDISREQLDKFLFQNINSYWKKWIDNHTNLLKRGILLMMIPRLTEWSVLGVARQLYTLKTGKIVSKTEAGIYYLDELPEQFHQIMQEALSIRKDNNTYPLIGSYAIRPSFKRMSQTVECVNYIIQLFNKTYRPDK